MEFTEQYDIVVVGAGVAGIAAALAAARDGFKTALVEKTIIPGGLATSGLVFVYLPLCDGNGTQVTYGISEELLKLSFRYGPGNVPTDWREKRNAHERERYSTSFSPASFVLALDETLQQAGVDIWFDTLVCATRCEDQRIKAIEVENKSGRGVINGYCFIDASGDADLAYHSGAQCAKGDNWLSIWALQTSLQSAQLAVEHHDGARLLNMFCLGGDNAGIGSPTDIPKMDGTDGKQVTKFVLEGRRLLREFYQQQHDNGGMTSRENLFPLTLPNMAQFRTTRRIVGSTTLTDNQHGRHVDDSVGLVADWRKPGFIWEIPYSTLVPQGVRGLLAAGRCISSEGDAWEVTRVIPAAALTGEIAGIAATLAVARKTTPDNITAKDVQRVLVTKGIPYHITDVLAASV